MVKPQCIPLSIGVFMSNDLIVLVEETLPLESPPVMAVLPSPPTGDWTGATAG